MLADASDFIGLRYNVCKMLKDFARGEGSSRKRTVFATIHQPSEEVFNLFDKAQKKSAVTLFP